MPSIEYVAADGSTYESLFEVNIAVDEFLGKIMYTDFSTYGFKNIITDFENPYDLDTLIEPGNYQIYDFINGPEALSYVYPIRVTVSIRDTIIYQFIPNMLDIYYRTGVLDAEGIVTWNNDWVVTSNTKCPLYCGETEPMTEAPFAIWINTSIPKYPTIHGYHPDLGWFGIGSMVDIMDAAIYDVTHKYRDIFLYLEEMVGIVRLTENGYERIDPVDISISDKVTLYNLRAKFNNHFDLGHMSLQEREMFNNLVSVEEVEELLEDVSKWFVKYVAEKINECGLVLLRERLTGFSKDMQTHADDQFIHTNWSKQLYWSLKSNADHGHNLDRWVTIDAADVIEGIIDMERMPDEAIDTMKHVLTHAERFALTELDVQVGDSIFVSEENDTYESGLYLVYDQKHLDSDEGYIYYRTRLLANIDYEDILRRPTTLEGYGITDGTLVVKDPDSGEFVYEYETKDRTLNYALTVAVRDYFAYITSILDVIEYKMNETELKDIWTLATENYNEYMAIKKPWDKYRRINGNQIPVQHEMNSELYNDIEEIYNHLSGILY